MTPSDEIDEKLARVSRRLATEAGGARVELARVGFLEAAELLRSTFAGRLSHLKTDALEIGSADCLSRDPDHGGPLKGPYLYDLSLKGHANAATQPDDRYAPSATQRPADLPYRGRPNQGKRKASGAPKPDRRSDPPQTWHDVYADR